MSAKKKTSSIAQADGILIIAVNKQARREYDISDVYEAGLVLLGSEVKAVRAGAMNLKESYVRVKGREVFLVGCHISPYSHSRPDAHEATRDRKLLLHAHEIAKLCGLVQQKGFTLVPLRVYFRNGRCKIEFGLGKGKKLHDKREDMRKREATREMDQAMKRSRHRH